jgi:bifunctional oligoribonuclease and PAP phosphatase NrnA
MSIDWTPFVELVHKHQRFLLMTHVRPDGDALGSELGLADALAQLGKSVRIVIASPLPPRYHFLDSASRIERFNPADPGFRETDVVIIVDTGTWNQLGDFGPFLQTLNVPKVVIDHHRTQDDLGALRLVDVTAEACGRLICDAARALGTQPSVEGASALYMALATDTGFFRHSSVKASTYVLAGELVAAGANPTEIYRNLFERNTLARWKLVGRVLDRLSLLAQGRVAFTRVYLADYESTGAIPMDTEELTEYPRSIDGVEVGLVFIEQPAGGIKVSFRSRESVDVSRLAEQFGGGGHRQASGAALNLTMDEAVEKVTRAVLNSLPA